MNMGILLFSALSIRLMEETGATKEIRLLWRKQILFMQRIIQGLTGLMWSAGWVCFLLAKMIWTWQNRWRKNWIIWPHFVIKNSRLQMQPTAWLAEVLWL